MQYLNHKGIYFVQNSEVFLNFKKTLYNFSLMKYNDNIKKTEREKLK